MRIGSEEGAVQEMFARSLGVRWWAALLGGVVLLGAGCWRPDDRHEAARSLFDGNCSRCHGLSETGPSPVEGLGFAPADLRRLSRKYGTPLDHDSLAAYIDGRHMLPEERSPDMPVWGKALYQHMPDKVSLDDLREGAIDLLIEYLQSVQTPAG